MSLKLDIGVLAANVSQDDEELERMRVDYSSGKMTTGEIKRRCAEQLSEFCLSFQKKRQEITDEMLDRFMTPRPLLCRGVAVLDLLSNLGGPKVASGPAANPESKNQQKKREKLRLAEEKKARKAREKGEAKAAAARGDVAEGPSTRTVVVTGEQNKDE